MMRRLDPKHLLGDGHDLIWLYHQNAPFKAAVDNLAGMLPAMIDGLAEESVRLADADAQRHANMPVDMPPLRGPLASPHPFPALDGASPTDAQRYRPAPDEPVELEKMRTHPDDFLHEHG
jgi:hypothetical protein